MKTLTLSIGLTRAVLGATLLVAVTAAVVPNQAFAAKVNPISCAINSVRHSLDKSGKAELQWLKLGKDVCKDVSETIQIDDVNAYERSCIQVAMKELGIERIFSKEQIEQQRSELARTASGTTIEDFELRLNKIEAAAERLISDLSSSHTRARYPDLFGRFIEEDAFYLDHVLLAEIANFKGDATLAQKRILVKFKERIEELYNLNQRISDARLSFMDLTAKLGIFDRLDDLNDRNILSASQSRALEKIEATLTQIHENNFKDGLAYENEFRSSLDAFQKLRGPLIATFPAGKEQRVANFWANKIEKLLKQLHEDSLSSLDSKFQVVKDRPLNSFTMNETIGVLRKLERLEPLSDALNKLTIGQLDELSKTNLIMKLLIASFRRDWVPELLWTLPPHQRNDIWDQWKDSYGSGFKAHSHLDDPALTKPKK